MPLNNRRYRRAMAPEGGERASLDQALLQTTIGARNANELLCQKPYATAGLPTREASSWPSA